MDDCGYFTLPTHIQAYKYVHILHAYYTYIPYTHILTYLLSRQIDLKKKKENKW
jgi:hypothetical protein